MAAPILVTPTVPRLKNVLFATDFSAPSMDALPIATAIARAFGGKLHLCHIEPSAPLSAMLADPQLYKQAGKQAAEQLAGLRQLPLLSGLDSALVLSEGEFKDELMKIIGQRGIDLVVAGTHGRTGLRKVLLGSVTEEICRAVTCPILTVGPGSAQDGPAQGKTPFERILFPTNLSDLSKKTVPYIAMLAEQFGAKVTLLHVLAEDDRSVKESVLATMRSGFPDLTKFQPEFLVASGNTAETVLRVAEEKNAGLIAMGIRNAFRPGVLRERTAYRIIAGARCPVLTVR